MEKYYEMFRGKYSTNKEDFFNGPDSPDHSDQDSEADGWSRLRRSWGLNEEEWVVWERNQSVIYSDYTVSFPVSPDVCTVMTRGCQNVYNYMTCGWLSTQTQVIIKILLKSTMTAEQQTFTQKFKPPPSKVDKTSKIALRLNPASFPRPGYVHEIEWRPKGRCQAKKCLDELPTIWGWLLT
jgi:hypothetical protein